MCQICTRTVNHEDVIINDIFEGSKWTEKYFDLRRWHILKRGSGVLFIA